MKFSRLEVEMKTGFRFREISPVELAEMEDKVAVKVGSSKSKVYDLHLTREKFILSCIAFPNDLVTCEQFGGDFQCNDENKAALFDCQTFFCESQVKSALDKMLADRLSELKNFMPGLFGGGTGQKAKA